MAIVRTAGTEIIRSASFEDIDSTEQNLIIGEQHHIYTVLSIIVHANALQASGNRISVYLTGYDAKEGTSAQRMNYFWEAFSVAGETFVWNDKFSFNGFEPTDFAGPLDNATKQNAIADQGSSVAQKLSCETSHASDSFEMIITFIDQNNA